MAQASLSPLQCLMCDVGGEFCNVGNCVNMALMEEERLMKNISKCLNGGSHIGSQPSCFSQVSPVQ